WPAPPAEGQSSLARTDTKTDTNGAAVGWQLLVYAGVCWLDFVIYWPRMLFIAATMSVLAAQRFGEEFGVQDSFRTCPIPTLAPNLEPQPDSPIKKESPRPRGRGGSQTNRKLSYFRSRKKPIPCFGNVTVFTPLFSIGATPTGVQFPLSRADRVSRMKPGVFCQLTRTELPLARMLRVGGTGTVSPNRRISPTCRRSPPSTGEPRIMTYCLNATWLVSLENSWICRFD